MGRLSGMRSQGPSRVEWGSPQEVVQWGKLEPDQGERDPQEQADWQRLSEPKWDGKEVHTWGWWWNLSKQRRLSPKGRAQHSGAAPKQGQKDIRGGVGGPAW